MLIMLQKVLVDVCENKPKKNFQYFTYHLMILKV